MGVSRLMLAVVLAFALAALPVTAAEAMIHVGEAQTSMVAAGNECPCCNLAPPQEKCFFKCCHIQAIAVVSAQIIPPLALPVAYANSTPGSSVSVRPDPPPPRS